MRWRPEWYRRRTTRSGGWDPGDATARAAAVAVAAGGCVLAVAAAREAHRRRKWVWGRLEEVARWI